eukprot:gene30421-39664_t
MGGHTTCERYLVSKGASVQEIPSHISKLKIDRPFKVPKIFSITKSEINTASNTSTSPVAINDSSFGVIDRLGYTYYASAITKVLKTAASPICVGIYARWGAGKSTLIDLIKRKLDPNVDEKTSKIVQRFESQESNIESILERSSIIQARCAKIAAKLFAHSFMRRMEQILSAARQYLMTDSAIPINVEKYDSPQFLSLQMSSLYSLLETPIGAFKSFGSAILSQFLGYLVVSYNAEQFFDPSNEGKSGEDNASTSAKPTNEYIFVDFNAWEYSASDELWTGLIKNLYEKVELRMSKPPVEEPLRGVQRISKDNNLNWKDKWRIKKAIEVLEKNCGGKWLLQLRCILILTVGIFVLLVALMFTLPKVQDTEANYDDIWAVFATGIPGCVWLKVFVDAIAAMNK